jgi:hypothetical protein
MICSEMTGITHTSCAVERNARRSIERARCLCTTERADQLSFGNDTRLRIGDRVDRIQCRAVTCEALALGALMRCIRVAIDFEALGAEPLVLADAHQNHTVAVGQLCQQTVLCSGRGLQLEPLRALRVRQSAPTRNATASCRNIPLGHQHHGSLAHAGPKSCCR